MSPELDVLDQLLGGDLPMGLVAVIFEDLERCRRAIGAMLQANEVILLDGHGSQVPPWRYRELQLEPNFWKKGSPYRLSITDTGAKRVE